MILTALRRMPGTWVTVESDLMQLGAAETRDPLVQPLRPDCSSGSGSLTDGAADVSVEVDGRRGHL